MANYPHMSDTSFPDVNGVDVWKLKNDFPFEEFDSVQMKITVCAVPWDVGLIHVGNAQIGGLGNVVDFGSEQARDAWFENITDKYTFNTEYRAFHMQGKGGAVDGTIKLPIPYDVLARYNYAIVEYEPMPVNLEGYGVSKWFYFIRESFMKAANTSEVELILDAWQTFIYGISIPYLMLERGHAPMAALSAEQFLANPIGNTRYVAGDDVTYDDAPSVLKSDNEIVFNDGDNVYACIVLDSAITGTWGEYRNTWRMPTGSRFTNQGVPNYSCVCIDADRFNDFILDVDYAFPQFKQAVKAVFFASDKMITLGNELEFAGYTFNYASANYQTHDLLDLTKASFGYDSKYANIAKLYTYPYAHIEIMDERGEVSIIRVEDTTGKLDVVSSLSTVYPFINLTANITGIGGAGVRSVYFKHLGGRAMRYGGRWQTVALDWEVPTFAVVQSNNITYDYATHYDRVQARNDADTAKAVANRNAATAKTNADKSALAAHDNAVASANTGYTNAEKSAANEKTNADETAATIKDNADRSANNAWTNAYILADMEHANSSRDAALVTTNAEEETTANTAIAEAGKTFNGKSSDISIASNGRSTTLANSLTEALTGITTDAQRESAGIAAIGGAVGAVLSLSPSGLASTATSYLQAGVSIHANEAEAGAQTRNNNAAQTNTTTNTRSTRDAADDRIDDELDATNDKITDQATNTSATTLENANQTRRDSKTIADNSLVAATDNAQDTYDNDILTVNPNNYTTAKNNADRTRNTQIANADRTYLAQAGEGGINELTKSTADQNALAAYNNALAAIENGIKQAALEPANTFGTIANGETATTRPMAVFAQVVTQNDGAIAAAGDEMLRFGYHCNLNWRFDGWQKMKYFTYWKVADMWIDDFRLPDAYADRIRFTLMGGVNVWRLPDIIGKVSIYDNL